MNTIKKLYREFFGLAEQSTATSAKAHVPGTSETDYENLVKFNKELDKTKNLMSSMKEGELDEAELLNHMGDYKGGVEYVLIDPAQAKATAADISQWAQKKGFTIVQQTISPSFNQSFSYPSNNSSFFDKLDESSSSMQQPIRRGGKWNKKK